MVVLNMPAKNGKKAWISIKNKKPEEGGSPYRILNVEPLDWPPDQYGNIAMNLEVEATNGSPTAFANARATMQQGEPRMPRSDTGQDWPEAPENTPQSPPPRFEIEDGVTEARKHLMRCCNLYNLCIAAADKAIAPNLPNIAQTQEQFQSTLASLWIEASSRRSTNGVDWWSWIDRMPDKPLPVNSGKHTATAPLSPKNVCTCENTDGDNPLCPMHSS